MPPGYEESWLRHSQSGRDRLNPKTEDSWRFHREDTGHWNHWEKYSRKDKPMEDFPKNCKKLWPGQKLAMPPPGSRQLTQTVTTRSTLE